MSNTINQIAEKILAKNIDKKEAIKGFAELSDSEKTQLILKLKGQLSDSELKSVNASLPNLKAVDQRSLTDEHRNFITDLTEKYEHFVPKSKQNVLDNQTCFVDQRRPFHLIRDLKDLHFQITYTKADGAFVYDLDGNEYIDISGDMGVNIFGHKAKFIVDAVKKSLDQGIPLAGYSDTIFKASKLFCELTGHERALFTQSGTEAVMFAVRIARAATQKKKIVIFDGAYHGLSDAVAAMKDESGKSFAMGPGMLQEYADQLIILDYGNMEQLDVIEEHADEIAAVLVEPVQSRHPYNQPVEFLKEVRKLTLERNIPLIFDEMITGFRVCPKGAQGLFGIKADMATYGKIPGGGLPTGVIAGASKYMDLIDGGTWQFGDDSMPKSKRTSMAGTHSQNPLKIASAFATLSEIKKRSQGEKGCDNCQCFQKTLNQKTEGLARRLNDYFQENKLPIHIDCFGSLFRFRFLNSFWGVTEALFFILLRMNGIETNIQGNCFLTTAHTDADIEKVIQSVKLSLEELIGNGFFVEDKQDSDDRKLELDSTLATASRSERATQFSVGATPHGSLQTRVFKSGEQSTIKESLPENKQLTDLMKLIRADLKNFQEGEV